MLFLFLSCAPQPDTALSCEPTVTWENWGESFFLTWCSSCHAQSATDRQDAPESIFFDSEKDVVLWLDRIQVRVIEQQTMPVGGGISTDELLLLEEYLTQLSCEEAL